VLGWTPASLMTNAEWLLFRWSVVQSGCGGRLPCLGYCILRMYKLETGCRMCEAANSNVVPLRTKSMTSAGGDPMKLGKLLEPCTSWNIRNAP
jgi:hypothetical protein